MKSLKGWDAYVAEAAPPEDSAIELPLTADEVYVIDYPTRRQGKKIIEAQAKGDVDDLLVALLGEEAGKRVSELSFDYPGYVLDQFLVDVMRKFGFIDDTDEVVDAGKSTPRRNGTRKRGTARTTSSAA